MQVQEIRQWDERLTDQSKRGWDNYKHLHIDLSEARIDQIYRIAGEYLYVEESSGIDAIAKIKLNRINNDALDLEKGVKIETVFIEIYITNEALQGEWLDLVFGINFKYKKKIISPEVELPWFDVRDYDADPTGVADSSAAWQACIDEARGCPIRMGRAIYRIDAQLLYSTAIDAPGLNVRGAGMMESFFDSRVGGGAMLRCTTSDTSKAHFGMNLRDFTIMSNSAAGNGSGIELISQVQFNIENVEINGLDLDGLFITCVAGDGADASHHGNVRRCRFVALGRYGINYNNAINIAGITQNRFSDNYINNCGSWCVRLLNPVHDIFENNTIAFGGRTSTTTGGLLVGVYGTVRPPRNVKVLHNWFEYNQNTDLFIDGCVRTRIIGNGFTTETTDSVYGIFLNAGSHGCRLEENEFWAGAAVVPYTAIYIAANVEGTKISGPYWRSTFPDTGQFDIVDYGTNTDMGIHGNVARTATVGGTGTGLIDAWTSFVTITSDNANKQITLPAPVVGKAITLLTTAIACELIATGTNVKINNVICSATNEAALVADSHYEVTCVSTTEWILVGYDQLGAHVAPIVPDAL